MTPTLATLAAVLVASLAGSPHCAGMCGVFVAMACGFEKGKAHVHAKLQTMYHGGRLIGYSSLGVLAGMLGSAVNLGANAAGLHHAAAILAATTMLAVGGIWLLREAGVRMPHVPTPPGIRSAFRKGVARADRFGPTGRALAMGLRTTLLPCGWLWAFALIAAGTASPVWGAAVMATFWIGTVPILAAVGRGAGALRTRFGPRVRTVAALAMIAIAGITVFRVYGADLSVLTNRPTAEPASLTTPPTSAHCPLCDPDE
ncbi:MAG: sulfite exporter TauE/SafE family protein [Phycisphaerales bacterium]